MVKHKLSLSYEHEVALCYGLYSDLPPLILAARLNLGAFFQFRRESFNPSKENGDFHCQYALFKHADPLNECQWLLMSNRPLVTEAKPKHRLRPPNHTLLFPEEKPLPKWCTLRGNYDFWLWCNGEEPGPGYRQLAQASLQSSRDLKSFQLLSGKEEQKLIAHLPL